MLYASRKKHRGLFDQPRVPSPRNLRAVQTEKITASAPTVIDRIVVPPLCSPLLVNVSIVSGSSLLTIIHPPSHKDHDAGLLAAARRRRSRQISLCSLGSSLEMWTEAARSLNTGRFTQFRLFSRNMGKAAFLIIALASAAMAAMMTGSVAHDDFGIPLDTIRTDALSAAGLIFAAVACGSLLTRKKVNARCGPRGDKRAYRRSKSGSLAMLTATRRASSFVIRLADARRPGSDS